MKKLLLLCLFLVGCNQPGRYQLISAHNPWHVWKIDTASGKVWLCDKDTIDCRPVVQLDPPSSVENFLSQDEFTSKVAPIKNVPQAEHNPSEPNPYLELNKAPMEVKKK